MNYQMIRTSERRSFKRCPQQWWWAWRDGLTNKEPGKALWFGSGWHIVMADYYGLGKKRSKDYIDLWREYCNTPDADGLYQPVDDMGEEWVDMRDLGEIMLTEYVKQWGADSTWDVIATEYSGEVLIPKLDGSGKIQYNFTFDGVYRDTDTKKVMLMEHKTAAQISLGHLSLDDQGGSYWAVAPTILRSNGVLGAKENIHGIMYNFARKSKPTTKDIGPDGYARNKPLKVHYFDAFNKKGIGFEEKWGIPRLEALAAANKMEVLGDISKVQPLPNFMRHPVRRTVKERRTQIERIKNEAAHMEAITSGALPLFKTPTMDCSRFCGFFNMCELHDAQGDWQEFARTVYATRDMYADHRKNASEV